MYKGGNKTYFSVLRNSLVLIIRYHARATLLIISFCPIVSRYYENYR